MDWGHFAKKFQRVKRGLFHSNVEPSIKAPLDPSPNLWGKKKKKKERKKERKENVTFPH